MKKQTFIAKVYNNQNQEIDFERWTCKKIETVIKNMKKLYQHPVYKALNKSAEYFIVVPTPNGYNEDKENAVKINF